jgi:DNA-binding transcriptional ArsR family regulator
MTYDTFFETIGNATRLKILHLLQEKPLSVSKICNNLKEEQSKISHNLKRLRECNFIKVKQSGKNRIYSLNKDTIVPLMNLVEKHVKTHCKNCKLNTC